MNINLTDAFESPPCFPLVPLSPILESQYERLILVTERHHIAAIDATGEEGLIVSGDWLLWQQCLSEGRHAIHKDLGLLDWDGKKVGHDHLIWANDWVYDEGRDMTLFRGVSLGRKFYRQVALVIADHHRMSAPLNILIRRFHAKELVIYDYRTEDEFLDLEGRVSIASTAAKNAGIKFTNRCQQLGDHDFGHRDVGGWPRPGNNQGSLLTRLRRFVVDIYVLFLGWVSLIIRRMNPSQPSILIVMTYITGMPLIREFERKGLISMYLGRFMPHKTRFYFWLENLKKAILPVDVVKPALNAKDLAELDNIKQKILRTLVPSSDPCKNDVHRYLHRRVINGDGLIKMALDVKWAERLIDEFQPNLVITDGLMDITSKIFLELAKSRGVTNAVTWHGPYVQDVKVDIFGCDPRMESLADYSLTWGRAHEDWLDGIGAKTRKIRTGNLVSSGYQGIEQVTGRGNVMILQFVSTIHEFVSPLSYEYFCYVEIVRMLAALGYTSVRVRFHPGASKRKYYEQINEFFGLTCEMNDEGSYRDNLEWADIIIGPANSGAALETIASGRPYFPVSLKPNAINKHYISGLPVFEDLGSLRKGLESGISMDQKEFLENFTSLKEFPNSPQRTWDVIEGIVTGGPISNLQ